MSTFKKLAVGLVVVAAGLALSATPAKADPLVLDFGGDDCFPGFCPNDGLPGMISDLGGSNSIGSNVAINHLGTSAGDSFALTGDCNGGTAACLAWDTTTGTMSITGKVDGTGIEGVLISGIIDNFNFMPDPFGATFSARGTDALNNALAELLGVEVGGHFFGVNASGFNDDINSCDPDTGLCNYQSLSTNIGASHASVPEPASMLLLGTGLVGVAGSVRRRLTRKL